jgi:hypothetical protein
MNPEDGIIWADDPTITEINFDLGMALACIHHMLPLCDIVNHPAINTAARHLLTKYQEALHP